VLPSPNVIVTIDLARIRANVRAISKKTKVDIYAVVKADAYGMGAAAVVDAIKDLVHGFYCFRLSEVIDAEIWKRSRKPTIVMVSPEQKNPRAADYIAHGARPGVTSIAHAKLLRKARPVLSVDTMMQRFGCPPEDVDEAMRAGEIDEAFTHCTQVENALALKQMFAGRKIKLHAAGSALLDEPQAWLDAVRPGLAMYEGAATVTAPLVEARDSHGPAGYTGFLARRHGVILAGYSNGLLPGPCLVNGKPSRILEVGMQSAFIEIPRTARVEDPVTLLGGKITESKLAEAWKCGAHEVCVRMGNMGMRKYVNRGDTDFEKLCAGREPPALRAGAKYK
jgi:alanine racemase